LREDGRHEHRHDGALPRRSDGCAEAFGIIVIEAVIFVIVLVIISKEIVKRLILGFIVAVQCDKVANNEFAHNVAPDTSIIELNEQPNGLELGAAGRFREILRGFDQ
jgi:hypothetical protein